MLLCVWFLIDLKIFQILCGTGLEWINSANGHVPEGSLCAGNQSDGEPLFIGRTHYEGSLTVGKIQRSHNCLYIPFGGAEHSVTEYEVLVEKLRSIYTSFLIKYISISQPQSSLSKNEGFFQYRISLELRFQLKWSSYKCNGSSFIFTLI